MSEYDFFHNSAEQRLKDQIIADAATLFPEHPLLVGRDYMVEKGRVDLGRGDLVFSNRSFDDFLVVEVITVRPGAPKNVQKLKKQLVNKAARTYTKAWAEHNPGTTVRGLSFVDGNLNKRIPATKVESLDGLPHFQGYAGDVPENAPFSRHHRSRSIDSGVGLDAPIGTL